MSKTQIFRHAMICIEARPAAEIDHFWRNLSSSVHRPRRSLSISYGQLRLDEMVEP